MKGIARAAAVALLLFGLGSANAGDLEEQGHHHHHHKHHGHHNKSAAAPTKASPAAQADSQHNIVNKMKALEQKLHSRAQAEAAALTKGHLLVNGPIPADFNERFAQAVAQATASDASKVHVTGSTPLEDNPGVVEVAFDAPSKIVKAVENDAAEPDSKLASGNLRPFLVAQETPAGATHFVAKRSGSLSTFEAEPEPRHVKDEAPVTPVEEKGIDIDTSMPYGDLEPFGREDTAQELTESSVKESDGMVDQLERAEVAEEKRAVFRSLTRLRGAAITSFDGVARSQTGNIDEYNKIHKWRKTHPLHHLADEESDVSKWAFPDNADF